MSGDPALRERFNREADLAAKLWHPHIVGVHDRGEHEVSSGSRWTSSMAQIPNICSPTTIPPVCPDEVATIMTAVAGALAYDHRGLLHRDVKPANIMLADLDDDGDQRVVLTDFGIARNIDDISGLTTTNMTVGAVARPPPSVR